MSLTMVHRGLAGAVLAIAVAGCSAPKPEPEIASSSSEPGQAATFPARVDAHIKAFGDAQLEVERVGKGMAGLPKELDGKVDREVPAEITERADQAGRSRAYVESSVELDAVQAFLDAEREELNKKVGGAAQFVAKKAGCKAEAGGAAVHALDKQLKKRLEERRREANDAQRVIERHRVALGKKDAATLEKHAEEVSRASYLAFVRMVELKLAVQRAIDEADALRKAADASLAAEQDFRSGKRTPAETKASEARSAALNEALRGFDGAVDKAKRARNGMEERIEKAQAGHRDAVAKLVAALRKK